MDFVARCCKHIHVLALCLTMHPCSCSECSLPASHSFFCGPRGPSYCGRGQPRPSAGIVPDLGRGREREWVWVSINKARPTTNSDKLHMNVNNRHCPCAWKAHSESSDTEQLVLGQWQTVRDCVRICLCVRMHVFVRDFVCAGLCVYVCVYLWVVLDGLQCCRSALCLVYLL